MISNSGVVIGSSIVIGCVFFVFVAVLYYLLWWKNRVANRNVEEEDDYSNNDVKDVFFLFCWKTPSVSLSRNTANDQEQSCEQDIELGNSSKKSLDEETIESELIRIHNLAGPPRFLFTINEETREDLKSDDGKSMKLRDFLLNDVQSPYLAPVSSPVVVKPVSSFHNPLFESVTEAELNRLRSSPPPKFKFLRDAEEKLIRKLTEETEKIAVENYGHV